MITDSSVTVDQSWMRHEGDTKYYQVFEFRRATLGGTGPLTLVHYGAMKPGIDHFNRPVLGGQTKIHRGALLRTKVEEKRKRGYKQFDTKRTLVERDTVWWHQTFGAKLTHELHVELFGAEMSAESFDGEPTSDPDNEFAPGKEDRASPDTRPAAWGTW